MKLSSIGFATSAIVILSLPALAHAACSVQKMPYGATKVGAAVDLYQLKTSTMDVGVLTYGGVLHHIDVPDKSGQLGDVILTLPDIASYEAHPSFSSLLGRYANRISAGGFDLDGQHFSLVAGRNGITTHGGPAGFGERIWTAKSFHKGSTCGVDLSLVSDDGDQGFPGQLTVTVRYALSPGNHFTMTYTAKTTKPTILTLANHAYFNLSGAPDVYNQVLMINADSYLAVDPQSLPTGERVPVTGSGLDLRQGKSIGEIVKSSDPTVLKSHGLDHMFALNGEGLREVASLTDSASGRRMTVSSTEPGLVTYAANGFDGSIKDVNNKPLAAGAGVSMEIQHFPDSPHHPEFPTTVVRPNAEYRSTTVYAFTH